MPFHILVSTPLHNQALCNCGGQILTILTGFELKRTMRSVLRKYKIVVYKIVVFSYIQGRKGMVNTQWEEHVILGGEPLLRSTSLSPFEGCVSCQISCQTSTIEESLIVPCLKAVKSVNTAVTNSTKQIRECEAIKLRLSNDAKDVAQLESLLHAC